MITTDATGNNTFHRQQHFIIVIRYGQGLLGKKPMTLTNKPWEIKLLGKTPYNTQKTSTQNYIRRL